MTTHCYKMICNSYDQQVWLTEKEHKKPYLHSVLTSNERPGNTTEPRQSEDRAISLLCFGPNLNLLAWMHMFLCGLCNVYFVTASKKWRKPILSKVVELVFCVKLGENSTCSNEKIQKVTVILYHMPKYLGGTKVCKWVRSGERWTMIWTPSLRENFCLLFEGSLSSRMICDISNYPWRT